MHNRLRPAAVAFALLAFPAAAGAQSRTAVVVPADATIVVPPRGAASALPRPVAARPTGHRPRLPPMAPARDEGGGLDLGGVGTVAGVLLPAIAAAALTAVLSNGGGGSGNPGDVSGPARTH